MPPGGPSPPSMRPFAGSGATHQGIHLPRLHPQQRAGVAVHHEPRRGRPRQRLRRVHAARLVQVRGADRGHEVRVSVAVHRHSSAAAQLASEQREQLLERHRPALRGLNRHVVPREPGVLVRAEVVARGHRRDAEAHALGHQVRDLGLAALGPVAPPPSPRPLETAQLALARPPDPPGLLLLDAHAKRKSRAAPIRPRARGGYHARPMCRVFGCVAAEPVSIRHELLDAQNPLIRQSEEHDSGWGMAVYERADGAEPRLVRFPEAAHSDDDFLAATELSGRIFNVHVRRATMGALSLENTHPFCLGSYTLGHNGTIVRYPRLLGPDMRRPEGDTDSEHLFNLLTHDFDAGDPVASLRHTLTRAVDCSPFSGLNILFSDGERLFAYRLGLFELHWLARPGQLLVASEEVTDEPGWHSVQQDDLLERAEVRKVDLEPHLRGAERGAVAAERAKAAAAAG